MSSSKKEKITPEVFKTSETKFLVRQNGKVLFFADEEKIAISTINSIAKEEVRKMETNSTKVFSRSIGDKEVAIYTQSIGSVWNGAIVKAHIFDIIPVSRAIFEKRIDIEI
jgi:hypothetical protein